MNMTLPEVVSTNAPVAEAHGLDVAVLAEVLA